MERADRAGGGAARLAPAPNPTKQIVIGKPGILGTRWIRDFLDGALLINLVRKSGLEVHEGAPHSFILSQDPGYEHVGFFCLKCQLHFFVRAENSLPPSPAGPSYVPCGTNSVQDEFPVHHLVVEDQHTGYEECQAHSPYYHNKYNPIAAISRYACSAPTCVYAITVDISIIRLGPKVMDSFLNRKYVEQRQQALVEAGVMTLAEARAKGTPDYLLSTAIRVLGDLLQRTTNQESLRQLVTKPTHKTYLYFGGPAVKFLRYLELHGSNADEDSEMNDDGTPASDEHLTVWRFPPQIPKEIIYMPDGKTLRLTGTQVSFYNECRTELLAAMRGSTTVDAQELNRAAQCLQTLVMGVVPLEKRLAIATQDHDTHPAYKQLGVLRQDVTKLVLYAFDRQMGSCPSMQNKYVQALTDISMLRNDDELQLRAAQETSYLDQAVAAQGSDNSVQELADKAYRYLATGNPDISSIRRYPDSSLIGLCQNRLDACPSDEEAVAMMGILADIRDSNEIRRYIEKIDSKPSRIMTPAKALEVLDIAGVTLDANTDIDGVVNVAIANSAASSKFPAYKAKALRVLAEALGDNPLLLTQANRVVKNPGGDSPVSQPAATSGPATAQAPVNMNLPVGLFNIGNTCYLNSILQYLYTLKPIRQLLAEFDAHKLDLSSDSIDKRLIGGNKTRVERAEAIAAQYFVQELILLFEDLQKCPRRATRPKQRIANAALLSVPQLLASVKKQKDQPQNQLPAAPNASPVPPQLPPRPVAPLAQMQLHGVPSPPPSEPDAQMANTEPVTTAGATDQDSTASRSSTQTLVNNDPGETEISAAVQMAARAALSAHDFLDNQTSKSDADRNSHKMGNSDIGNVNERFHTVRKSDVGDVEMLDAPQGQKETLSRAVTPSTARPEEEEGEVEELIQKALDSTLRSGTAQQDVEEVMGNIMLRLQEAIASTSEGTLDGKTAIQLDQIMETFYCVIVNLTAKAEGDGTLEEIAHERWITAYPDEQAAISMYEALDRTFDKQFLDGTQRPRYSVIRHLPPILHICIQRSAASGQKNLKKVDIPSTICLDRYMEDNGVGDLSELRDRGWDLKLRLGRLKAQTVDEILTATRSVDAVESTKRAEEALKSIAFGDSQDGDLDNKSGVDVPILDSETATLNPDDPPTPAEDSMSPAEESQKIEAELEQLWAGRRQFMYSLHAIICHSGAGLGFGHYWVFIYDFNRNVWLKYNDDDVTEHTHEECMNQIEARGNPYYVAYVRTGEFEALVDIPVRTPDFAAATDKDMTDLVSQEPVVYGPQPRNPVPNTSDSELSILEAIEGKAPNGNGTDDGPSQDVEMGTSDKEASEDLMSYDEAYEGPSENWEMDVDSNRPFANEPFFSEMPQDECSLSSANTALGKQLSEGNSIFSPRQKEILPEW